MQQIMVIGHLGQDATLKRTNGNDCCTFSVAANKKYKDAKGNQIEETTWYSCIMKDRAVREYLKAGTQVFIQGGLSVNVYQDKNRNHVAGLSINVEKLELIGGKKEPATARQTEPESEEESEEDPSKDDDDLPF